jgi:hypothetical protein
MGKPTNASKPTHGTGSPQPDTLLAANPNPNPVCLCGLTQAHFEWPGARCKQSCLGKAQPQRPTPPNPNNRPTNDMHLSDQINVSRKDIRFHGFFPLPKPCNQHGGHLGIDLRTQKEYGVWKAKENLKEEVRSWRKQWNVCMGLRTCTHACIARWKSVPLLRMLCNSASTHVPGHVAAPSSSPQVSCLHFCPMCHLYLLSPPPPTPTHPPIPTPGTHTSPTRSG